MKKEKIYGELVDSDLRCVHWHSKLDVIANRCETCGKLYACYQCHNNTENHAFGRYNQRSNQLIVMCGVCGHQMTYARYDEINQCDQCETPFNPGCSLHKHLYVC
ncbi:CHY zinc finger protein [uncultured Weissella sp.]|uniref:CHY zinc finger protein n=1 Tax=uncultured Weissella sp. TaxID=253243 RepID=UPI0025E5860B|nr:CHY zinc finger protein [uncultured Weissella sp.]